MEQYTPGEVLYINKLGKQRDSYYPHQSSEPFLIESLARKTFVSDIACGDFHSVALDENGRVFTWGGGGASYNKGQCGHGDEEDVLQPKYLEYFDGIKITKIVAGGYHNLALTENQEVFSWGNGVYGECGYGEFFNINSPRKVKIPKKNQRYGASRLTTAKAPEDLEYDENIAIKHISAGARHSLILTREGQLYSFGYGQHGQLGLRNNTNYCIPQFVKDFLTHPLDTVEAGWHHSLALTTKGDLYACGYGEHGQLGLSNTESKTQFTLVEAIGDKAIDKIYAGGNHSWIALNDVDPIRSDYTYPEPLNDVSPSKFEKDFKIPIKEEEKMESLLETGELSNDYFPKEVLNHEDIQKRKIQCSDLQCVYTDTKLSHRFIRFELLDEYTDVGGETVDDYIRAIYKDELGTLQHRVQNDEDITNGQGKVVSHARGKKGKFYTINMVCNPENNEEPPIITNPSQQEVDILGGSKNSIGIMLLIKSETMKNDPQENKLSHWATLFYKKMHKYTNDNIKFFELRPYVYAKEE